MSRSIEALVIQSPVSLERTEKWKERTNSTKLSSGHHTCALYSMSITYIVDLYIKFLLYQLSASMSLGFFILLPVGFISCTGFLFLLNGEWSLTHARQGISDGATPPALMLGL